MGPSPFSFRNVGHPASSGEITVDISLYNSGGADGAVLE